MNRDAAKHILRICPLDRLNAEDPRFQDALQMLRHDPDLAAWFAREHAIDRKRSKSFQTFPTSLGRKGEPLTATTMGPQRSWWWRPTWISVAAASLALVGVLAVLPSRAPEKRQFVEFRSYIVQTAAKLDHLDFQTSDRARIREWLRNQRAPEDFVIPAKLNEQSRVGCRVFAWNGQKVSLVCFAIESKKIAHLFVTDRSFLTNLPDGGVPHFQATGGGIATASWSDAERIYILALGQGEQDLKKLLL